MERWKINLYTVWAAQILSMMSFGFGLPFLPYYIQELGVVDQDKVKLYSGILSAVPAISMGIMAPIWGILADKYGKKLMLLRAMFFGSLILAAMGLATRVEHLIFLRIVQGAFTGTVTASAALVASNTPEKRLSYALGFLSSSTFIGYSAGPAMGGYVAEFLGYRASFFIGASLLIIDFFLVLFIIREKETAEPTDEEIVKMEEGYPNRKSNPIRRGSILKRIIYKHPKTKKTTSFIVKDDSQVKELYKLNDDLKINIVVQRNDKLEIVNTNVYHLRHTKLENTIYSYATLTSVNPNTFEYTAVAHGIQIGGNSNYRIKEGFIYLADTVYNAKKSRSLSRGNIDADIISNKPIGTVTTASIVGIKGILTDVSTVDDCSIYVVGKYSEIELGDAYILSQDNKTNKIIKSKIEITKIDNPTNTIIPGTVHFKVVDKNLIKERGGTVRGMSGSPIIQNGKIIGALSHGNILFSKVGKMTYIGYMIENGG